MSSMISLNETARKLKGFLRDGKGKEAESLLVDLIRADEYRAWFTVGRFDYVIRSYGKYECVVTGETRDSNHARKEPVTCVLFVGTELSNWRQDGIVIDVQSAFSPDVERRFGYIVLQRFEETGPRPDYDVRVLEGTLLAAREMASWPIHRTFGENVERLVILSALYMDPVPLAKVFGLSEKAFKKPSKERRGLLNRYVERLYELGVDRIDVRDHFLECLQHNAEWRSLESVLRLAGAKCFVRQQGRDPKLASLLHETYLQRLWREMTRDARSDFQGSHEADLYPFGYLAQYGMVGRERDENLFRTTLTDLVSRGRIRQAWEIIDALGDVGALRLYNSTGHADIGVLMSEDECHDDYASSYLKSLVPAAFRQACERKEYGNAAALVNRFGAPECLSHDQMHDAVKDTAIKEVEMVCQKALDHKQSIPIETESYYVRD